MQSKPTFTRPAHGGNLVWASQVAGCPPTALLDFSASINPLGPPASAIAAIQTHLEDLTAYPDPHYHHLRAALGQVHALPPEWILPGNGSAELLTWACRDLATLNLTCLPTPAFGDYRRALEATQAEVLFCSMALENKGQGNQGHPEQDHNVSQASNPSTIQAIEQAIGQGQIHPGQSGLLLNNPHNPTGELVSRDAIAPYLDQFALVVVDEAFMDFLPPDQQQSLDHRVQDCPNLVILRSLTKFYSLPGLRLGYAIAHPDRLHRWQQWRDPWPVNVLAAAAAEAVLQDTDFQQQTWHWLSTARSQLSEGLAQLPGLYPLPGVANFLLVHSERSVPDIQIQLLQRSRILIRDCLSFPELGDRYFRVAVRTPAENQQLIQSLAAILEA